MTERNGAHHPFDSDPPAVEVRDRTRETVHLGERTNDLARYVSVMSSK